MERKWADGPWFVVDSDSIPRFWIVQDPTTWTQRVAFVPDYLHTNAEANAHLIAAAPTMADYVKRKADDGCAEAAKIWALANGT